MKWQCIDSVDAPHDTGYDAVWIQINIGTGQEIPKLGKFGQLDIC